MADDGSAQQESTWPLPKFYFQVNLDGELISFQEATGLDPDAQSIEYRHSNSSASSTIKMPGIKKFGNVTLKKGIVLANGKFMGWLKQAKSAWKSPARDTITIKLMDQDGDPTMTWTLANAWPTRITSTDLKSDGNDVALEALDIAYDGLTIANG